MKAAAATINPPAEQERNGKHQALTEAPNPHLQGKQNHPPANIPPPKTRKQHQ
jgi:hypothetical protein